MGAFQNKNFPDIGKRNGRKNSSKLKHNCDYRIHICSRQ